MPSDPENDFSAVSLHNQAGAATWPIVTASYIYLRKDVTALGDTACLLKAFLEFIISDEGQALLPATGAVEVPDQVKKIGKRAIEKLVMPSSPACTAWSFEGSRTQRGTGQQEYVISQKRRSYNEYVLSSLESKLAALTDRVASLESESVIDSNKDAVIAALRSEVDTLQGQASRPMNMRQQQVPRLRGAAWTSPTASCCDNCSGRYCSPSSGKCYASKEKYYFLQCPGLPSTACCERCPGQYCSPVSGTCYRSKDKDYLEFCPAMASAVQAFGAGGEALGGDFKNDSALFFP
eukprot:TRINITY_DN27706_c1_g1_i4.p1 TRINITY_DN27706_c1_g1~~TRINITY_DN27706_c1_g1_i4.p1  ORF type:complete len:293 (+),score=52.13 TRINITY_DN27706_c1_g1_i4:130-1008(+)